MLEKAMLAARKTIESTYIGTCTVYERRQVKNSDHITNFSEVSVFENQPCRISFSSVKTAQNSSDLSVGVFQTVKLFISPDIEIKPNSKITVTQNGCTVDYTFSSVPAVYQTHQEIALELFENWA